QKGQGLTSLWGGRPRLQRVSRPALEFGHLLWGGPLGGPPGPRADALVGPVAVVRTGDMVDTLDRGHH
ncbi:MAG: hypothetical protein ABSG56_39385, partial [Bryobacteraceae bacterium]